MAIRKGDKYLIEKNYSNKDRMLVYCIENKITGQCYVGISTIIFKNRLVCHFHKLRSNKHTNRFLQRSYNKYGESSFKVTTLYKDACSVESLLEMESLYCDLFNSHEPEFGFNLGAVGVINKMSKETKAKMKLANNANWNDERRAAYSNRMKKNNPFSGISHTEEAKNIMSAKAKERIKTNSNYANHFKNTTDESKERGRLKRIGMLSGNKNPASQPIIAYNPTTLKEHLFSTVSECAAHFGLATSSIERRINKVYKGGYYTPHKFVGLKFKRI